MQNRRIYLDKFHKMVIKTETVPVPSDDEALVKIAANGICGSDVHFYADGRLGNFVVDVPYVPGHEASGTIAAVGKNVCGLNIGEQVAVEPGIPCGRCRLCLSGRYNLCPEVKFMSAPPVDGTFCDYVCVRASFLHKIPEDMPLAQAAFAEPAAVAVHAVSRAARITPITGKTGLIFGMGAIGLLTLQAFHAMGGGYAVCADMLDNRLALARELGAGRCVNVKNEQILENAADIVFETAGSAAATQNCIGAAAAGGVIVQVGWPAGNIVPMDIAGLIEKELTYTSVNRYANAFGAALTLIADGRIKTEPLVTHTAPFEDTAKTFECVKNNPEKTIKALVLN